MYEEGQGVQQNFEEAIEWYGLAAKQGLSGAQSKLGLMYQTGKGVIQNYKEAVRLYRESAEQGNVIGQKYLGVMYVLGQGVSKDYVLAHMWFSISGSNGNQKALKNMRLLEKEMSPSQVEKAQKMTRKWKSNRLKQAK